jgi:PAS domain S-box-containing protein
VAPFCEIREPGKELSAHSSDAEVELRQTEEHFRRLAEIVESTDDAIISTDLSAVISTWNKGAERLYGYAAEEIIGSPIRVLIPPDRHPEELAILAQIKRGERVEARDTVRRRKDGSLVDVLLTVSLLKNAAGEVVGGCSIVRDITDRKRLERDVQLLMRELDHRARNLLGVVQAMVSLSQADTVQDLKDVLGGRIGALSHAHNLLAETRWNGADLTALVRQELSPYCSAETLQTNVTGPVVSLSTAQAQPFAMLFHELTTNAVKYGALSVSTGRVRVIWTKGINRHLVLQWIERGGPLIRQPERRGFGMRVIEEVVCRQLNGQVQFDWAASGLTCHIEVPDFSDEREIA